MDGGHLLARLLRGDLPQLHETVSIGPFRYRTPKTYARFTMNIVSINSKDELQKVLAIQKSISDAAVEEISKLSHLSPPVFVKRAGKVLEKYARYATLTEFQQMEHLADSE